MSSVKAYKWIFMTINAYACNHDFVGMDRLLDMNISDDEKLCLVRGTYMFRSKLKNWEKEVERLKTVFDGNEMAGL